MEEILDSALPNNNVVASQEKNSSQEIAWVIASQRGDVVSFNRLVLKWERSIFNLSLRMLRDMDEATEATQEVFLLAFRSISRFRLDSQFSTWLYRIAANHCTSRLRKRPPGVHVSLDDTAESIDVVRSLPATDCPEREFFKRETSGKVRKALESLHPEQQIVVELKFFQELTFEQIASIVGAPLSTVKSRFYAGLDTLKLRLSRVLPDNPS